MGVSRGPARAAVARRSPGRAPGGRAGGRAGGGGARDGDGAERAGVHRDRGDRPAVPEDVRPAVLGGVAGGDRGAGRAGAGGGRGGLDPHARLDVQPRAGLGVADDPVAAGREDDGALRARGGAAAGVARALGALGGAAGVDGAERRRLARVLRRLRRVDGHATALVGGPRVAAGVVGRAVHGQGRDAGRRRAARGRRRRRHGAVGVQPRRQQPGRDTGVGPRLARGRRGRRGSGRGGPGRRRAPRQRRGQGVGAGRSRGDDRAAVPVGARRRGPGGRGERAGRAEDRHRLGAARAWGALRSASSTSPTC